MSQGEQSETPGDESPILCARCLRLLKPGRGEFFVVQIEAVADPSPPDLDWYEEHNHDSTRRSYEELVEQLKDVSEQEAKDQVFRRLEISLCNDCFSTWFENPAGNRDGDDVDNREI